MQLLISTQTDMQFTLEVYSREHVKTLFLVFLHFPRYIWTSEVVAVLTTVKWQMSVTWRCK